VEVVPPHPEIEIEHVPADPLTGVRDDGRVLPTNEWPLKQ
jgi:hypothetical protein